MKIREISVTYGGKLNMGDYNSAHIEMTATALLEPEENEAEAIVALLATAQAPVQAEARRLYAKRGARVDEIFAGLPVEVQQQVGGNFNGNSRANG